MRITFGQLVIAFTFSCISYAHKSKSQELLNRPVTVSFHQISLDDALSFLEKETAVKFVYSSHIVDGSRKVNLRLKQAPFKEVLDYLLNPSGIYYRVVNDRIVLKRAETRKKAAGPPLTTTDKAEVMHRAEESVIRGKVTDEKGEGLPGVNIVVKGATHGTISEVTGDFELTVRSSDVTLVFSFVGYRTQEVNVASRSNLTVSLQPEDKALDEVIVVGYGTVRKGDLTGSVSSIDGRDIRETPVIRVDQALQGRAAGVYVTSSNGAPGASTTIRIRGGNSINAGNEPLYVIDGFIGGGDLNQINPADIESIEILKDASATAIYGARGANGVVMITTKRGKEGQTSIQLSTYYGVQEMPRKIPMLNAREFVAFSNESAAFIRNPAPFDASENYGEGTDWQDEISRTAAIKNIQLSVNGGNEKTRFFISGNFFDQDGIIINSGAKRYQTRINLDSKLTPRLSMGTSINLGRTYLDNNKVNIRNAVATLPTTPVFKSEGEYGDLNQVNGNIFDNPVALARLTTDYAYRTALYGNFFAEYRFLRDFSFRTAVGANIDFVEANLYQPSTLPTRWSQQIGGRAQVTNTSTLVLLNENTVNYSKVFGQTSLKALVGYTVQTSNEKSLRATGEGFTNDASLHHNLATSDPTRRQINSDLSEWAILSMIARADLNIRGKYLLTLTGRRDGSSRFGDNNKYAFFPSAAIGWRLSDEPFIRQLGIFDNLKLRSSFGISGNQGIDPYRSLSTLSTQSAVFNGIERIGYNQGRLADPYLKWETTSQFDAGIEMGFFNGRLQVEADYYYKLTRDLLLEVEIPWQTGFESRLQNIGRIRNSGVEFMFRSVNIDHRLFKWSTGFNIAGNKNKVLNLGGKESIITLRESSGNRKISELRVGDPVGIFTGAVYEGTWSSESEIQETGTMLTSKAGYPRFKDVDGNGKFEANSDFVTIGNAEPLFFGGISNSLKYGNFKLDLFLQYAYGNDVLNLGHNELGFGFLFSNVYKEFVDRWTPENTSSRVPRAGSWDLNKDMPSTRWVEDGSFLRLKNVVFSYELPVRKLNIRQVRSLNLFISGTNLFLLTRYSGFDPEVSNYGTSSILRGFDNMNYPQSRTITAGLNLAL